MRNDYGFFPFWNVIFFSVSMATNWTTKRALEHGSPTAWWPVYITNKELVDEYSFVKKQDMSENNINPAKVSFEHFYTNLHRHLNLLNVMKNGSM